MTMSLTGVKHGAPFRLRDRALVPRLRRRELPLRREAVTKPNCVDV